ncbi:MAG: ATPase [Sphaerochaeta sp.]|jgi:V/A-type H+-transporting ATPase subunit I|nr:ATPase [Sphaerochaeta sp.]MCI2044970.1 ATPase [Sphaerochaeta sp.]MCI2076309.1 ATPase [Sphaerochaeta sp.]MCI2104075.1 ATPase [Sphaerochaeta sp.]
MNLFTRPMKLLTAVVLEQKSDAVVKALLEEGVMDFVHIDKLDPKQMEKLSTRPASVNRTALEDMRHRIEAMLRQGQLGLPSNESLHVKDVEKPDLDGYRELLDDITKQLSTLKDEQRHANQTLLGLGEMKRYIQEQKYIYLDLRVGRPTHGTMPDLSSKLSSFGAVIAQSKESTENWISLTMRRDSAQVTPLLDKFGWTETSNPELQKTALVDISSEIDRKMEEADKARKGIETQVNAIIKDKQADLDKAWCNLRLNELCDQIRSYFSYTRNTTLFSGWVPADKSEEVSKAIYSSSDGQCVIEWTKADAMPRNEVPVAVSSPKAMMPFAKMVSNYGTPEYGSVNPTPFVMVAYLAMFALMFADVGQGFVLLVFGLLMMLSYKKNPMKKDGMISRNISQLLVYLGGASIIGGALFGSYFGFTWLPALWFNYDAAVNGDPTGSSIKDVYGILGMTIKFGIAVIYTGLFINWTNLARKKAWLTLFLDKNGVVGGVLFGTGLYLAYGFAGNGYKSFPNAPWASPVITTCLILILVRGFLEYALSVKEGGAKKGGGQVVLDSVMAWLVDVLEIFCGYMSNTLSFMRVAGLGIAHVCLMISFRQLSEMVGGVGGLVIYVLGNLLVIVLEGLSAGIQSLRLNYYEFFSRYFTGKGIAYEPVGLYGSFGGK